MRSGAVRILVVAVAIAAVTACGASPEQRIQQRLEELRLAAEQGKTAVLRDFVREDYADEHGNDRAAVLALVGSYLRISGGLHVWMRIDELRIEQPGEAQARLLVALAAGPIERPRDLAELQAEIHRLTLDLVEARGGTWQLIRAQRAPATFADVL
jgi:hypothetical protein